jgi:ureidoglycolate hydrolase
MVRKLFPREKLAASWFNFKRNDAQRDSSATVYAGVPRRAAFSSSYGKIGDAEQKRPKRANGGHATRFIYDVISEESAKRATRGGNLAMRPCYPLASPM